MSHDPLCDPKSRVVLHDRRVCDCNFIARVRADEREAAAQRLKVVRDAADVALLGTLQTTRDRVIAAIDALEKP